MRRFEWASTSAGRAAIAALAFSVLAILWSLVHAVRLEPVPEVAPPGFASASALAAPVPAAEADVEAAVQADLFAADRVAPARRYQPPGEESDENAEPAAPPVEPVVLGTAVSDSAHSFATVQLGDGHPVIVHIGDRIGEYTVRSIGRERVVFTTAAKKRLDIPELKP